MTVPSETTVFLSGDEAIARGAYEAGVRVAASYPGTPATEVLEHLSVFPEVDAQWSVNEKVAFEVALAASIAGARSIFSAKHVGLNVAMDPLMISSYSGVNAGFVVVSADDPELHSSQNEQDNRLMAKMAKMPLLEPSSPSEAYEFTKTAFDISEKFDIPVFIRITTRVAHTKENFTAGERSKVPLKAYSTNIQKNVMVPSNASKKHLLLEQKLVDLKEYSENTPMNRMELRSGETGFITDSVSYLYVREMYPDASVLKLGMPYPFPDRLAAEFSRKVKDIYIVEELEPFIEDAVKLLGIPVHSRDKSFLLGELRPELVPQIVSGQKKQAYRPPARKPVLCPGCSHRSVFHVLRKLKLNVTGDIGCYTLGASPPLSALHTQLCMGTGMTFLEGFSKVLGRNNVVGVIGDSTFMHSGITGLINMAYNKGSGLLLILDNSTTAMTGTQNHPATGLTAKDEKTKQLSIEDICRACGADKVDVVDPFDLEGLETIIKTRTSEDVLSVVIARYPCRLIEKNSRPAPSFMSEKCRECGICFSIDCPSIRRSDSEYLEIDRATCVGCDLCADVCPFGALVSNAK